MQNKLVIHIHLLASLHIQPLPENAKRLVSAQAIDADTTQSLGALLP